MARRPDRGGRIVGKHLKRGPHFHLPREALKGRPGKREEWRKAGEFYRGAFWTTKSDLK